MSPAMLDAAAATLQTRREEIQDGVRERERERERDMERARE